VELNHEQDVTGAKPDFTSLKKMGEKVIITAPGKEADFVSRFFAPIAGIDEDPVTGSAHSQLIPFWSEKLGNQVMHAKQLSSRGGDVYCEQNGDRVTMGGRCVFYMKVSLRSKELLRNNQTFSLLIVTRFPSCNPFIFLNIAIGIFSSIDVFYWLKTTAIHDYIYSSSLPFFIRPCFPFSLAISQTDFSTNLQGWKSKYPKEEVIAYSHKEIVSFALNPDPKQGRKVKATVSREVILVPLRIF
jgi:hypothetical protein